MALQIGDRVKVVNGAHNTRSAPNSSLPYTSIPQDTVGTITAGPAADQAVPPTTNQYFQVNWDDPSKQDGWIVVQHVAKITGAISGTVNVPGATVSVDGQSAVADAGGNYSFQNVTVGNLTVHASASGYVPQDLSVTTTAGTVSTANFSLVFMPGAISGSVKDESDMPLSGSLVSVPGLSTSTDANGAYSLSPVSSGTVTVTVSMSGYLTEMADVDVVSGQVATQDFVLEAVLPIGSLTGHIRNQAGVGVIGASVVIKNLPGASVITDGQGMYTIPDLEPFDYVMNVTADGMIEQKVAVTVTTGDPTVKDVVLDPLPAPVGGFTSTEFASIQNLVWAGFGGKPSDAGSLHQGHSVIDIILRDTTNAATRSSIYNLKKLIVQAQNEISLALSDLVGATVSPTGQPRSFYVSRGKQTIATVKNTRLPAISQAADAVAAAGAPGTGNNTIARFKSINLAGAINKVNAFNASLAYSNPFPPGRGPGGTRITIIGPHGDYIKAATWLTTAFDRCNRMFNAALDAYAADALLPGYNNKYQQIKFCSLILQKIGITIGTITGLQFEGYSNDPFFRILSIFENLTHGGGGPTVPDNDCSPDFCHGASYDFNNMKIWTQGDAGQENTRPTFKAQQALCLSEVTECWQATDTSAWYMLKFPECEVTGGCGGT